MFGDEMYVTIVILLELRKFFGRELAVSSFLITYTSFNLVNTFA